MSKNRVLITGQGHSGTNLVTEMVRVTDCYAFFSNEQGKLDNETYIITEDRVFFNRGSDDVPPNYGTKLALGNPGMKSIEDWPILEKRLKEWPDLKVIYTVRHPVDTCLSLIYREFPRHMGGDGTNPAYIPDYTVKDCIGLMQHVVNLYKLLQEHFDSRLLLVRMEDILTDIKKEADRICEFLQVPFNEEMLHPYKYNRHFFMSKRYTNLDTSQIDVYKRWETVYNKVYATKRKFIEELCIGLSDIAEFFSYSTSLEG